VATRFTGRRPLQEPLELIGALVVIAVAIRLFTQPRKWKPPAEMGQLFPHKRDENEVEDRRTWPVARQLVLPFAYPGSFRWTVERSDEIEIKRLTIEAPLWPGAQKTHLVNAHHYPNEEAKRLVTISTPNGLNASRMCKLAAEFHESGFAVLVWDYPGYGDSQGSPNYDSCIAAARRVADIARELAGERELWFYGWSMGGPHAAEMASRHEGSMLILDRTFASIGHVIIWPSRLAQWLLPYHTLECVQQMENSEERVLFHGGSDDDLFGLKHMKIFEESAKTMQSNLEHMDWPPVGQMIEALSSPDQTFEYKFEYDLDNNHLR